MIKHLNKEDDFKKILSEGNYLVDFYAQWCGPCKMIAPILESLEEVNVIKVDVDEHQNLANEYGVMSIPTLIYFKNGIETSKEIGFRNKEQILEMIK